MTTSAEVRGAVETWARCGWRMFPVHPVTKRPLVKTGRDHAEFASSNPEQAEHWPEVDGAPASIGIPTGAANGVVVIDYDAKHDGEALLRELEELLGPLPRDWTVRTQSGGGHVYLAHPGGGRRVKSNAGVLGCLVREDKAFAAGVDVRGDGGLAVFPPSAGYTWESRVGPRPPPIPEAWLPHLLAPPRRERSGGDGQQLIPEGGRNDELFRLGATMRGMGASHDEILAALRVANETRCEPPLDDEEVERVASSAADRAPLPGGGMSDLAAEFLKMDGPVDIFAGSLEPGSDAALVAEALSDVRAALENKSERGVDLLFEPAADILSREYPDTLWLVRGLLTEGGIGMIGGEPKTFKTWLGTEIALAVATGTSACGEFETGPPRRVAYFYAEDFGRAVRNRMRALIAGRGLGDAPANLYAQPRGRFLDLLRDEDLALIVASVRKLGGVDLLVLDPLRDLHSGEEDKSDSMSEVMRRLRAIETVGQCTVLGVHHTSKASADSSRRRPGQRLRGSGAIHGSVDSGVYLSGTTGDGVHTFANTVDSEVKSARSAGRFELELTVTDDEFGEAVRATWERRSAKEDLVPQADDTAGNILTELEKAALRVKKPYLSAKEIRTKVGGGMGRVNQLLAEMEQDGLVAKNYKGTAHCGWRITRGGVAKLEVGSPAPAQTPDISGMLDSLVNDRGDEVSS